MAATTIARRTVLFRLMLSFPPDGPEHRRQTLRCHRSSPGETAQHVVVVQRASILMPFMAGTGG
jgi:hypothetical protein